MGLVLLVRHGQASFGAEDYDVLSETGLAQGRLLGQALATAGLDPGAVVHGAMRRQRDTAAAMVEAAGWPVVPQVDEGWNEFDHLAVVARAAEADPGLLEDHRAFQRAFEEATARWTSGAHDGDYEETWAGFVGRVRVALDQACAGDGVTVVSTSGGPIAAAFATLVDREASAAELARMWATVNTVVVNSSVTRVIEGPSGRRLLTFNEHSHLPRGLVTYR